MIDTILVAGSTGNVGSQVAKQLSTFKIDIRAAVQSKDRANVIKNTNAHLIKMDFNRPETFGIALEGVQKLFLLTPFVLISGFHQAGNYKTDFGL
jgi:NAD(P)H dehydrogenase (quinone)